MPFPIHSTFRWNDVNGRHDLGNTRTGEPSGEWADRMHFEFRGYNLFDNNGKRFQITNKNYEYKILLHNRIGKDPYLQIPHFANDAYIRNLAYLVKYGADKDGNPFQEPTRDPYFPPLNANLRVNLEFSNEIHGTVRANTPKADGSIDKPEVFRQAWLKDPQSPDGKRFAILNYDNMLGMMIKLKV